MSNPWERIGLNDYEAHMKSPGVLQLQTLSRIMAEQLERYRPATVAILGAAAGNGLEHVDKAVTIKAYAVDINAAYLEACAERYGHMGFALETVQCDLSAPDAVIPPSDLLICNLIVEYLGVVMFAGLIRYNINRVGAVSCVIQRNNGNAFVSLSETAESLQCLDSVHRDIGEAELAAAMRGVGFHCTFSETYALPNAKEFVRMDFIKV